jgi:hypothetical protein
MRDLRIAARNLGRSPALLLTVAISLGLGLGACLTLFVAFDTLYLKSLPFDDPQRVVSVLSAISPLGSRPADLLPTERMEALLAHPPTTFAVLAAYGELSAVVDRGEAVRGTAIAGAFFDALGIRARLGRVPDATDVHERVVVLSDGFWRSRFNADQRVVGNSIELSGTSFTVIGVLPKREEYPRGTRYWVSKSAVPVTRVPVAI